MSIVTRDCQHLIREEQILHSRIALEGAPHNYERISLGSHELREVGPEVSMTASLRRNMFKTNFKV